MLARLFPNQFAGAAFARDSNVIRIGLESEVLQNVAIMRCVRARLTSIVYDLLVILKIVLDVSLPYAGYVVEAMEEIGGPVCVGFTIGDVVPKPAHRVQPSSDFK
jgi:hypothetical protein